MHIEFFDNFEEMMKAEQKAREAADSRTFDWQKDIKPGDCFISPTPYGFNIYGVVLKSYKQEHLQNYRYCNCYSIACPNGERGDVHVSTIGAVLSRDEFEVIKRKLREGSAI
jgi:hypothetical protein